MNPGVNGCLVYGNVTLPTTVNTPDDIFFSLEPIHADAETLPEGAATVATYLTNIANAKGTYGSDELYWKNTTNYDLKYLFNYFTNNRKVLAGSAACARAWAQDLKTKLNALTIGDPLQASVKTAIIEAIDDKASVLPQQLKSWQWISQYYMCSIGEVYKAAVPSGMKMESETQLQLNEEFDSWEKLTKKEMEILDLIQYKKFKTISQIQKATSDNHIMATLRSLMKKKRLVDSGRDKKKIQPEDRDACQIGKTLSYRGECQQVGTGVRETAQALSTSHEISGTLRYGIGV
jgi:hypothetical protein